jgi:hypothetical protein
MEQAVKDEFARPSVLVEVYPEIKEAFTPNEMGVLLKVGLVRGRKLTRGCEVNVMDVFSILAFRSQIKAA